VRVASQASATLTSTSDAEKQLKEIAAKYDLGPFSYCDELEYKIMKLKKTVITTTSAVARLQATVKEIVGCTACVRSVPKPVILEMLDVSCIHEADDVASSLIQEGFSNEEFEIRRLVVSYRDTKRAVVSISGAAVLDFLKEERLKVGFVMCRIRIKEQKARCFHCHGFGHNAAGYKEKDLSGFCLTCVEGGHRSRNCNSPPRCVLCEKEKLQFNHFPWSGTCGVYWRSRSGKPCRAT
jgi:hypothetical protein